MHVHLKHGSCALGRHVMTMKGEVGAVYKMAEKQTGWMIVHVLLHARTKSMYLSFLELYCPLSSV